VIRETIARLAGRSGPREMPFLEHLEELRRVILASLGALVICSVLAYFVSGTVLDYIVVRSVGEAQFLHPMEAFNVRFKLALLMGAVLALPFISFQIWSFVLPGLMKHERRVVVPLVTFSTVLFIGGIAFSYWVLTPLLLRLLMSFATEHVRANITVDYLLDFILKTALGTGILFQLPLVVVILSMLRIVTPRFLWSKWRHALVIITIVSAVVTPGDAVFSTLVLAVPMLVLYFMSAILSSFIYRGHRRRDLEAARMTEDQGDRGPDDPGEAP
jgi:sec-independent protein translocase protein TatC